MTFELDYYKILQYAKFISTSLQIEPEELVNDAYVNLYDKEYSIDLYKKEIKNLCLIYKYNQPENISYGQKGFTNGAFTGDFVCKRCKDVKPAGEFRIEQRPYGKKQLRTICKSCEKILRKEFNIKKYNVTYNKGLYEIAKNTDKYKSLNKNRVKKYVKNNNEKWNQYLKERYKSDKEQLSDNYLKKLLRTKYKDAPKSIISNPNFIDSYRQILIQKKLSKLENKQYL